MTKRQARMQLTRDDPEADSNPSDTEQQQNSTSANISDKSKRVYVVPKSMSGTKMDNLGISSLSSSSSSLPDKKRQVNQLFKEEVEKALSINSETDLSVLFEKYKRDFNQTAIKNSSEPFKFNFQPPSSTVNIIGNSNFVDRKDGNDQSNDNDKEAQSKRAAEPPKFNFQFSNPLPSFNFNLPPIQSSSSSSNNIVSENGIASLKTGDIPANQGGEDQDNEDGEGMDMPPEEPPSNIASQSGEGEEDEEAVMEQRVKTYQLDKEKGWIDLGIAILKVKSNKIIKGKERILCRVEASAKILINALVTSTMTAYEDGKKELHLMIFDEKGLATKYLIRTKENSDAKNLHETINKYK